MKMMKKRMKPQADQNSHQQTWKKASLRMIQDLMKINKRPCWKKRQIWTKIGIGSLFSWALWFVLHVSIIIPQKNNKPGGSKLFDSEDEDDGAEDEQFQIKPQFEGKAGQKVWIESLDQDRERLRVCLVPRSPVLIFISAHGAAGQFRNRFKIPGRF